MNRRFKSWLLAFVTSAVSAGIVTTLNLVLATPEQPQPAWLIELHAACAFVGAFAITRFIQGTPASLKGPTTRSTVAQGVVADTRIGTVNFVVPGNSAFFFANTLPHDSLLCAVPHGAIHPGWQAG
ncbi:hypothetical protein [Burkholderia ambifaria]|uniref:hypothetical protein n=1 Tax=Burkholderia ambifaria TaxID=152480 RepID=UPI001F495E70|nr:hypothetical protein [Burkholderia ambifaria]